MCLSILQVKLTLIVPMRDGPGHGQAFVCKGAWCNTTLLIHSNWLSLSCNWLCIYIYLCNFMYNIYIYCIWYYNHVQRFDSPKIGSKPFGDSNPEHHRPFPIWPPRGTSACGRKSGAVDPAAARSHGPWRVPSHEMMILCHEMMILWRINDDLLGLSI